MQQPASPANPPSPAKAVSPEEANLRAQISALEIALATLSPEDELHKASVQRVAVLKKQLRAHKPVDTQISDTKSFLERAERRKSDLEASIASSQASLRTVTAEIAEAQAELQQLVALQPPPANNGATGPSSIDAFTEAVKRVVSDMRAGGAASETEIGAVSTACQAVFSDMAAIQARIAQSAQASVLAAHPSQPQVVNNGAGQVTHAAQQQLWMQQQFLQFQAFQQAQLQQQMQQQPAMVSTQFGPVLAGAIPLTPLAANGASPSLGIKRGPPNTSPTGSPMMAQSPCAQQPVQQQALVAQLFPGGGGASPGPTSQH